MDIMCVVSCHTFDSCSCGAYVIHFEWIFYMKSCKEIETLLDNIRYSIAYTLFCHNLMPDVIFANEILSRNRTPLVRIPTGHLAKVVQGPKGRAHIAGRHDSGCSSSVRAPLCLG